MKFKAEKHEIRKINFLTKITSILFGIFLTSSIFALSISYTQKFGLWLGLFANALLIFLLYKYSYKNLSYKYTAYGSLGCIILVSLITFVGLSFLTSSLEGF